MTTTITKPTTYLGMTKKVAQCKTSQPIFSSKKTYNCMWCTLVIKSHPLGCPVKRINHYAVKSKLGMDTVVTRIEQRPPTCEYVTYGVFCSPQCIKAFINNQSHDPLYRHSTRLLANMVLDMTDKTGPLKIVPAPHYTMLTMYGGDFTEIQFKQATEPYIEIGKVSMHPLSVLHEQTDHQREGVSHS